MEESILQLLEQHLRRSDMPEDCFTADQLLTLISPSTESEIHLDALARHILECATCARRWEIIQSDAHVDLAELYALERLDDDLFVKMRAEAHLKHCGVCRRNDQALDNLVIVENPRSVHYGNLVASLRQMPQLAISLRSESSDKLIAIVLEQDGRPALRDDHLERVQISVGRALLSEEGRLTVELDIPSDYSQAQLAVSVSAEEQTVMFPQVTTAQERVAFVAETRVQGSQCKIASSQLALWITRRY